MKTQYIIINPEHSVLLMQMGTWLRAWSDGRLVHWSTSTSKSETDSSKLGEIRHPSTFISDIHLSPCLKVRAFYFFFNALMAFGYLDS